MATTVGVLGTGNMGGALVRGWAHVPDPDLHLLVYDVIAERAAELADGDKVRAAASAEELAATADVLVLVVKPKDIASVLAPLRTHLGAGKILISSAAGVMLETVREAAGPGPAVFRIMPNLGVGLGEGVVALAAEPQARPETVQQVLDLLGPLGLVKLLPEDMFDAVTAVSGSSPAFLALAMEAMEDGAVRAGMPRDIARAFLRQTALATSLLLQAHPGSAADIKDRVSSPAGTTIAGLAVLEDEGTRGAFLRAIEEATKRSAALRAPASGKPLEQRRRD